MPNVFKKDEMFRMGLLEEMGLLAAINELRE